jgi:selenocysteine-specific elongation factor
MATIGTAGHVDHGKSLLVEAITGIDPDRLAEEKARGMTIDLGFAWTTLPSGRSVSIVDVPGHERFIRNMLAGAGGIDVALVVVAADDGVMPQTREHLAILDLLDIRSGVVALTKRDLVDDGWLGAVADDVREALRGTSLAGSPVVACSSVTREGLDELLAALDFALQRAPERASGGTPRLPIDRAFTIDGFGTVVTGTLLDGELHVGDEVELAPDGRRARIRGLQSHRESVERAQPGTRTAVNLAGVAKDDVRRGMVLTAPGWLRGTTAVDARVRAVASNGRALRHNMPLTLHAGAAECGATLRLLDRDELRAGQEAWAQLKLDAPLAVVRGDRFVLRTPEDTVAGGVIVDAAPQRHKRNDAPTLAALEALLSDAPEDLVLAALRRSEFTSAAAIAAAARLAPDVTARAVDALVARGAVVRIGDALATASRAAAVARQTVEILRAYHEAQPLRPGMPAQDLRGRLGLSREAFDAASSGWEGVRVRDGVAALADFAPAPPEGERAQIEAWLAALRASPYAPPANRAPSPAALAWCVRTGAVVDCGGGLVFDARAFDEMTDKVRAHVAREGAITVAQARDLFGTSRKYAQALLEELDRRRVTYRDGDRHVAR